MALNQSMISAALLCAALLLVTGAGNARADGHGHSSGGNMRGRPATGGKGHGSEHGGMQGGHVSPLKHNATLYANLTDASNARIGQAEMSLFLNTNTSDYLLSYSVRVKVPAGDTAKSASLLSGSDTLFSLSPNGFVARGNSSYAAGTYKGLSALKTAGGQTYLAVVEAMIAAPGSYSAQVLSANAASGLASGVFAKRTANGQQQHHGVSGVKPTAAAAAAAVKSRSVQKHNGGMRH